MEKETEVIFTGKEGGPIELALAQKWVLRYQKQQPDGIKSHFIGRHIIEEMLALPGCLGIRIYYGTDQEAKQQLVFTSADKFGNDLPLPLPPLATETTAMGVDELQLSISIPMRAYDTTKTNPPFGATQYTLDKVGIAPEDAGA